MNNTMEEFDNLKTKVLKYILYQRRTEQEVRNKFLPSIEENTLEDIIEYLKKAGYINDKEYIERKIDNFIILKNLSIREIEYKLKAKGISKKELEDYMLNNIDKLNEYEIKSAKNIIYKKNSSDKMEIKQYLYKKGYKAENINTAFEEE